MLTNLIPAGQREVILKTSFFYFLALLLVAAIGLQPFERVRMLTSDAVVTVNGKFYYGFLSNLGILLWCATASICLFSFTLLRALHIKKNSSFLVWAGLLTLALLIDDQFLLHEQVFPKYLGINEKIPIAFYPVASVYFLFSFRHTLLKSTPYLVLLSALGFLALSVAADSFVPDTGEIQFLVEDGLKFLGITGWFCFFSFVSFKVLKTSLKSRKHLVVKQVRQKQDLQEQIYS